MSIRLASTHDLKPSERRFVKAMSDLSFGRFEHLKIEHGELVLDPWPTTVCSIKFGAADVTVRTPILDEYELKAQVAEFFEYVRAVASGDIRFLELRHGLPFFMEIESAGNPGHDGPATSAALDAGGSSGLRR